MRRRSFANLLADLQGGIRPKPGQSFTLPEEVPEEAIRKAWGYVPAAVAFEEAVIEFKPGRPGFLRVKINWLA